jgi:carbamoylphosphate synthase small subunit
MDLATGRVYITSHNHGFAAMLPPEAGEVGGSPEAAGASEPIETRESVGEQKLPPFMGVQGGLGGRDESPQTGGSPGGSSPRGIAEIRKPFGTPYGAAEVSHVNLNDGVVEGIRLLDRPAFSVQYHPESAPGPHDAVDLFDEFCALMDGAR